MTVLSTRASAIAYVLHMRARGRAGARTPARRGSRQVVTSVTVLVRRGSATRGHPSQAALHPARRARHHGRQCSAGPRRAPACRRGWTGERPRCAAPARSALGWCLGIRRRARCSQRLAAGFPDVLVLVLVRAASVQDWDAVARIRARVTGSPSSTGASGAGMVCLCGTVTIRSGRRASGVGGAGSSPLGWCGRWSPGRADWNLADAPVDVEALFAEEQQRRRKAGR